MQTAAYLMTHLPRLFTSLPSSFPQSDMKRKIALISAVALGAIFVFVSVGKSLIAIGFSIVFVATCASLAFHKWQSKIFSVDVRIIVMISLMTLNVMLGALHPLVLCVCCSAVLIRIALDARKFEEELAAQVEKIREKEAKVKEANSTFAAGCQELSKALNGLVGSSDGFKSASASIEQKRVEFEGLIQGKGQECEAALQGLLKIIMDVLGLMEGALDHGAYQQKFEALQRQYVQCAQMQLNMQQTCDELKEMRNEMGRLIPKLQEVVDGNADRATQIQEFVLQLQEYVASARGLDNAMQQMMSNR